MTPKMLAKNVAKIASDHHALDIEILDLRKLASFTDFFIVSSGKSDRQVSAVADAIHYEMKKKGRPPLGVEGVRSGHWALVDFGDVVAHVFHHEVRDYYQLEKLWGDAPRVYYKGINK